MTNITAFAFATIALATTGAAFAQTCTFTTQFEATLLPGIQGDFGIAETEGTDLNDAGEAVGSAFAEMPAFAWRGVRWPVAATTPQILTDGMGRVNGIAENGAAAGEDVIGGSVWDRAHSGTSTHRLRPPGHRERLRAAMGRAQFVGEGCRNARSNEPCAGVRPPCPQDSGA